MSRPILSGRLAAVLALTILLSASPAAVAPCKQEAAVKPPHPVGAVQPQNVRQEVQRTSGDLSAEMKALQEAADAIIGSLARGDATDPRGFRSAALRIVCAMPPRLGPANAWLYAERQRKLRALATASSLPEGILQHLDTRLYDQACADLRTVQETLQPLGYAMTLSPADRGVLLWTPTEGFSLTFENTARNVGWRPPYAGTPAGPSVPERQRHPSFTLYLFPAVAGEAWRNLARREQPGELLFFTGGLLGYALQPPQSGDVQPDRIADRVLTTLAAAGLFYTPPTGAAERLSATLGLPDSAIESHHGLLIVRAGVRSLSPPWQGAVLWVEAGGVDQHLRLTIGRVGS